MLIILCFKRKTQNFNVLGPGGIGKTTAMKHFAMRWAKTGNKKFKFKFVFHLELKLVTGNESLENVIVQQHKGLKANTVNPRDVGVILENKNIPVLLILTGMRSTRLVATKILTRSSKKTVCGLVVFF